MGSKASDRSSLEIEPEPLDICGGGFKEANFMNSLVVPLLRTWFSRDRTDDRSVVPPAPRADSVGPTVDRD